MATKEKILEILVGETGSVNQAMLSEKLGEPISSFTTQLGRMVQQGLLEKNEQKEYTVTEEGRASALRADEAAKLAGFTPLDETLAPTEESLKTTEYQQFIEMGRITGVVPLALIAQVANHIWRGGDFRDLTWVWKGLTEMGIRPDLAQRWFHSWRSFLRQAVPAELANVVGLPQTSAEKATAKGEAAGKGKRDYIISPNDTPLYVGEGLGDMDYEDAVRLSTVRAAALARGGTQIAGQPATPATMADDMAKIFNAVKEVIGPQSKGKSYIVKPGEEGYMVEEVEEGKPTLIATPGKGNTNPSPSFFVDTDGSVQELAPGKPIVIMKQTAPPSSPPAKTFIVRQTAEGMVAEEFDVGKPIIINAPAPAPGASLPPMLPFPVIGDDGQPVYDKDGKPVYANIEPMMKWMGFQGEQRRADERNQAIIATAKTFREHIGDLVAGAKAAIEEKKGGAKTLAAEQPQMFQCAACSTQFSAPPGWAGQPIKCPGPGCGREYTKEELLGS